MKHQLLIAAAATAMMAVPSFAAAQDSYDGTGWYLKGQAGIGQHTDIELRDGLDGDVESAGDLAYGVGIGYDFGENWRVDLDGTSMYTDLGAISNLPASYAKLRTEAVMLNAIYDFSDFGRFEPYVGAGIGLVRGTASAAAHDLLQADDSILRHPACNAPRDFATVVDDVDDFSNAGFSCQFSEDKDVGLGWQLLAGLGYNITDNLSWDTNYRYMRSSDLDFEGTFSNELTGEAIPATYEYDGVGAHQVMTGFRYRFGGAAVPPPPPAPIPVADYKCWDGSMVFNAGQCPAEPVQEPVMVTCWDGSQATDLASCPAQPTVTCWDGTLRYSEDECPVQTRSGVSTEVLCGEQYRQEIIYYEFDKGQSAETRNTINRILDVGEFCDVQGIRVVGHTDTSGAASYNLALSKRRAQDALNELVRQGIDRNVITSEGKGETEPFVQTGDGVKEQLNRRTEVLITLGSVMPMMN